MRRNPQAWIWAQGWLGSRGREARAARKPAAFHGWRALATKRLIRICVLMGNGWVEGFACQSPPSPRDQCRHSGDDAQRGFAAGASPTSWQPAALSPPRATPSAQCFPCLRSDTCATRTRSRRPSAMCLMARMSTPPNISAAVSIAGPWEIQAGRSVYERHNHACWISMPGRTPRSSIPPKCARAMFPALGISRVPLRLRSRASRKAWGPGDIRLHSTARQRLDASPNGEGLA